MLQFIVRRILIHDPDAFCHFHHFICHHPVAARRLSDHLRRRTDRPPARPSMQATLSQLEQRYGLGQPIHLQYFNWISNILLRGDFGQSFTWNQPVNELIWDRLGFTMLITLTDAALHLDGGLSHRHLLGGAPVLRSATMSPPSSAFWAWPSPTFCWR